MGFIAVKCPECGADIQLDDSREFGFCNYCGAKVVQDKVKVEHSGKVTVEVNNSPKIQNWLTSARRARATGFNDQAAQYYDLILAEDPNNWEATFYSKYCRAMEARVYELATMGQSLVSAAMLALPLTILLPDDEIRDAVKQIVDSTRSFFDVAYNTCEKGFDESWPNVSRSYIQDHLLRCGVFIAMPIVLGSSIDKIEEVSDLCVPLLKDAVERSNSIIKFMRTHGVQNTPNLTNTDSYRQALTIIRKYEPNYGVVNTTNNTSSSGGCYVATCVYGSYDCPQVWTLRRYRDDTLASTWYGRAFIRTYYAVSPTLVAWFGHTDWFKKLWRGKLDRMVDALQNDGVADTPYNDKPW